MRSPVLTLGLFLIVAAPAFAQVPPEKAESTFTVADGLEFKLWASEPLFVNPTCMDIDHKGRVWVCESVNYRCKLHRKPLNRKEGDRIVILEDTKGTGKADKATTFYQAPDFLAPLGIAVAPYPDGKGVRVYVCHSPDILVFEDKEGKGKADGPPKKLLSGFGGVDHDHGVHGILIGPDGKLYFSVGDTGVHGLQSSDGKGRKWTSNDTDCRAGTIWRCDLDGTNLELIAHNFRNEYEPCVDSFGTIFTSDNDDDGNEQTRICYVMPGGNYGYHPRGPGQSHWHEEQPGVVPKILRTGFGSPTGMCVYEGTLLPLTNPTRKRGGFTTHLLHTDAGPREVRCYHLKPDGAGYQVEKEVLVSSTDTWFRPSDICVAPDGSAFVADWYDPGVGGHGMGDTTRGRIYRLAPKGNKPSVPSVELETPNGLLAALASANRACMSTAILRLQNIEVKPLSVGDQSLDNHLVPVRKEDEQLFNAIKEAAAQRSDSVLRSRALWQLASLDGRKIRAYLKPLVDALDDPNPQFSILALRAFRSLTGHVIVDSHEKALHELDKLDVGIRREALLLLPNSRKKIEDTSRLIYALAKQYDGEDRFYLEAIGIAIGYHDQKRREIILADFDKHFPEWNDKVADLVWELRPPSVMPKLPKRLTDAKLTPAQRARIVDILAASDDKDAGKALLKVLQANVPAEVRERVFANLRLFLPGKWRNLRNSPELAETIKGLLAKPQTRISGLGLIAAAEHSASLDDVIALAKDLKQPTEVLKAAVETLGSLPSDKSVETLVWLLKEVRKELGGDIIHALGQLSQRNEDQPGTLFALDTLQSLVQLVYAQGDIKQAAVEALAGSRAGTIWLLDQKAKNKLPHALIADAGRLLRNSPHLDLRNKAMIAFPPAKLDPNKLPDIAKLAKLRGNVERGKQFLAATAKNDLQCMKCHTIHGVGGQIGPDLSSIGKKASRENLFESILYPSKAIADQFVTWNIVTKDGKSVSGLLIEETGDHVLIRDANGKDTKIGKKEIEAREKDAKSLMPDNLLAYMTEDELVDMVEYLLTLNQEEKGPMK